MIRLAPVAARLVAGSLCALSLSLCLAGSAGAEEASFEQIEEARERYSAGSIAFAEGRYADAEAAFKKVYAVLRTPALLFETALSQQKQGHWRDASVSYTAYLREDDKMGPKKRMRVNRQVMALRARADWQDKIDAVARAGKAVPAPTRHELEADRQLMAFGASDSSAQSATEAAASPSDGPRKSKAWVWGVVGAVVGAAAIGGITTGVLLGRKHDDNPLSNFGPDVSGLKVSF